MWPEILFSKIHFPDLDRFETLQTKVFATEYLCTYDFNFCNSCSILARKSHKLLFDAQNRLNMCKNPFMGFLHFKMQENYENRTTPSLLVQNKKETNCTKDAFFHNFVIEFLGLKKGWVLWTSRNWMRKFWRLYSESKVECNPKMKLPPRLNNQGEAARTCSLDLKKIFQFILKIFQFIMKIFQFISTWRRYFNS